MDRIQMDENNMIEEQQILLKKITERCERTNIILNQIKEAYKNNNEILSDYPDWSPARTITSPNKPNDIDLYVMFNILAGNIEHNNQKFLNLAIIKKDDEFTEIPIDKYIEVMQGFISRDTVNAAEIAMQGIKPKTTIEEYQTKIKNGQFIEDAQIELPVKHHFALGIYARELFIPAGVMLTGQIHKYEQFNILIKGDMSVLVDGLIKRIKAPFFVTSPSGTKRIALAHEDSIWLTVLGTDLKSVQEIEERFIAKDEQEYLDFIYGCEDNKFYQDDKQLCLL